ncbi:MAG: hydrogenase iron-sulfur subunit [Thermodesulfobacteriota bacterium]|nr:hydrogenase iron-sulfur subunit [Thermodesulfobacteriota bacterium]
MNQKIKIIAFMCNWAPWSCYTGMGDKEIPIPDGVNVIRVMCAGRVTTPLLLKAFEKGADGVLIVGCRNDNCQNGSGAEMAESNIGHTREILGLLGLGTDRLQYKFFLAHEFERLSSDLFAFVKQINGLGRSPISRR